MFAEKDIIPRAILRGFPIYDPLTQVQRGCPNHFVRVYPFGFNVNDRRVSDVAVVCRFDEDWSLYNAYLKAMRQGRPPSLSDEAQPQFRVGSFKEKGLGMIGAHDSYRVGVNVLTVWMKELRTSLRISGPAMCRKTFEGLKEVVIYPFCAAKTQRLSIGSIRDEELGDVPRIVGVPRIDMEDGYEGGAGDAGETG